MMLSKNTDGEECQRCEESYKEGSKYCPQCRKCHPPLIQPAMLRRSTSIWICPVCCINGGRSGDTYCGICCGVLMYSGEFYNKSNSKM